MSAAKIGLVETEGREAPATGKGAGSLARGLRLIEILAEASRPLSLADIANLSDFDTSTTHRLLQVLVNEGYALKDDGAKRYLASPKSFFPLSLYHPLNVVRRDAEHTLISLRDELGETTGIVMFCFGERILLELAHGRDPLTPYYGTWLSSPLHGSASGKVLLMSMPQSERQRLLRPGPYQAHTSKTITDPEALERELASFKETGYVVARDDAFIGLTALGAPIRNSAGVCLGCFVVSGRTQNFADARIERAGVALRNAADLFSHGTPSLKALSNLFDPPTAPRGVSDTQQ